MLLSSLDRALEETKSRLNSILGMMRYRNKEHTPDHLPAELPFNDGRH